MSLAMQLLQRLAAIRAAEQQQPQFTSGATLASEFAVTRTAIWKAIGSLRERGTEIEAVTHRGYRLAQPASPLSVAGVCGRLSAATRAQLRSGQCLAEIASTNSALLAAGAPPPGRFDFLTAEYQHAGRGRRGRSWLAPPGGALCLSWSWCFEGITERVGALSLAAGVAVLRGLAALGLAGVQLKWPNDLVTPQGKLGGILIELRSEAAGPVHVVAGLGLNVTLSAAMREFIAAGGTRATDLTAIADGRPPPRESLVAAILDHNIAMLREFPRAGFTGMLAEYQQAGQIHRIIAGEVSVRAHEEP
jgi:BirA family biotin operon repressor/biotin-[acetyl-CoA-carboxylase] ligase